MASSKTFFRPFCVRAEHSTYLTALWSRASLLAASSVMGRCRVFCSCGGAEEVEVRRRADGKGGARTRQGPHSAYLLERAVVVAQVSLCSDEKKRRLGAVVENLRHPLRGRGVRGWKRVRVG